MKNLFIKQGKITRKILHFPAQRGVSLVISLLMLVVVLMLSISLANLALQGEKAARGDRDRQIALSSAEAALKDAEMDIDTQAQSSTGRSFLFDASSNLYFEDGCGKGDGNLYQGLCLPASSGALPIWLSADIASDKGAGVGVKFGHFTGQTMITGMAFFPCKLPRYVIEAIPDVDAGQRADEKTKYVFRVTAIGFGASPETQVVLQSVYRKAAQST